MARYIDADKLLEELQEELDFKTPMYTGEQNEFFDRGLKCAIVDVEQQPTADVVEVVRCKDCKHATFYSCKNDACYKTIICEYKIGIGDENFYCACAEPRTPKERGADE